PHTPPGPPAVATTLSTLPRCPGVEHQRGAARNALLPAPPGSPARVPRGRPAAARPPARAGAGWRRAEPGPDARGGDEGSPVDRGPRRQARDARRGGTGSRPEQISFDPRV